MFSQKKKADLVFKQGKCIELAFASLLPGKEHELGRDYFPAAMPIIQKYGGRPIGSFAVQESNSLIGAPKIAVFFEWPNIESYHQLHEDEDFTTVRPIRDRLATFFANGFFFESKTDQKLSLKEGSDIALLAYRADSPSQAGHSGLISLQTETPTVFGRFSPIELRIFDWQKSYTDEFMQPKSIIDNAPDAFRLSFNFPN